MLIIAFVPRRNLMLIVKKVMDIQGVVEEVALFEDVGQPRGFLYGCPVFVSIFIN
jgi:hypothetical protein